MVNAPRFGDLYQLVGAEYIDRLSSPTFPDVPKEKLYEFLAQAAIDEVEAELGLRTWLRLRVVDS